MSTLINYLKKKYYRQVDRFSKRYQEYQETKFKEKYLDHFSPEGKIKICIVRLFYKPYTMFFTSSDVNEYGFYLVEQPEQADVVVFINSFNDKILSPAQNAIFFIHEPQTYSPHWQSEVHEEHIPKENLKIVSHLRSPSAFIKNSEGVEFHRSIPYVHFYHNATYEQLNLLDGVERPKQICSIVSSLNQISGHHTRREFLEKFSYANPSFDMFGKFGKLAAAIPSYRGQCMYKWKTLGQYKYNLVIENAMEDYYISEKIFDSLICGCMPIYYGSDKIFEIIPREWFYYLPSLEVSEIGKLNEFIATDAYKIVADNRAAICKEIYEKFSFYGALDKLLRNEPLSVEASPQPD